MLTDDIKQNIMKYLNNGVSGSSQEQKPVALNVKYEIDTPNVFQMSNAYITNDNKFSVYISHGWDDPKSYIIIDSVEKIIEEQHYQVLEIPDYNNYKCIGHNNGSIDRDEEGRFYCLLTYVDRYENPTDTKYYLVIFNDFLTDGVIQINKAYNLHDYTTTASSPYNATYLTIFSNVKKANGSGDYYLYNRNAGQGLFNSDLSNKPLAFPIVKLSLGVGEEPTIKTWYYNMSTTAQNQFKDSLISATINIETDTPYMMIEYTTAFNNTRNENYKIGKLILPNKNEDITKINIKTLYTSTEYIGATDFNNRQFQHNGNYINNVLYKVTSTKIYFKYILANFNESITLIDGPENFDRYENWTNENTSMTNDFIIMQLSMTRPTTYRIYKIDYTNNTLVNTNSTSNIGAFAFILSQYNLHYVIQPSYRETIQVIKDVPVYGRATLPKQKLFNSAIFRAIKKCRNRRANI